MWTQLSPVEYCPRTLQGGGQQGEGRGEEDNSGRVGGGERGGGQLGEGWGKGRGEEDNKGRVGGRGGGELFGGYVGQNIVIRGKIHIFRVPVLSSGFH